MYNIDKHFFIHMLQSVKENWFYNFMFKPFMLKQVKPDLDLFLTWSTIL